MTARLRLIKLLRWSFAGVVVMSVSTAEVGSVSGPEAPEARRHTAPAAPYAQATWVKLGELVPTEKDAPDVYVRLVAIEGEVVLPVDHVR